MTGVFIIAEAGVNHNGSLNLAKKLIDAACRAGADAVKFQTFCAAELVSPRAPLAKYQRRSAKAGQTQYDMIRDLELSSGAHRRLREHCRRKKIIFMSSPFDFKSIELLSRLRLPIIKIPSGEITNIPYLRRIGALNRRIIMSTGMSTLAEVKKAVDILLASGASRKNITVLHCNTEYPTPMRDANLRAMLTMRDKLNVAVGYSDHTEGIEAALAAAALGASVIEKHLTLDRGMEGPDHKASLMPDEFRRMVKAIRNIEKALGSGEKKPSLSELKNLTVARKSIVAAAPIQKGEAFSEDNLALKRPAGGLSPLEWDRVIGRKAARDFSRDERIEL